MEVLLNAGSEGMTVTEVVDAIQRRQLARLHGRTPHNSITRCLSADDTFIRLQPGRYVPPSICRTVLVTTWTLSTCSQAVKLKHLRNVGRDSQLSLYG